MNGLRCTLILLSIVGSFVVGTPTASSQNLTDEWIEKAASPLVENQVADGLSIGYIEGKHWGIVHLGHTGRSKKKADNLTLYEIGSISKVFTSLLLADAVVRGEIDLDSAVDVPNSAGIQFPSRNSLSIKWIDLSTHRSGLPRLPGNFFLSSDPKNPYREYDSKKAAAFLNEYQLPRQPGKSQEYSNFAVSVLGYLVAQNADKTYQQLLQERIAGPLKMADCTVPLNRDQKKRFATPHSQFGSATSPWMWADLPGAGGIKATMRDMMRFAKAQLNPPEGQLGEAIELAWKQQSSADASGSAMGLGWMIGADGQTRWHNGGTGGFRSALYINRELNNAVVILCNTSVDSEIDQLAMQLMTKASGQDVELESSPPSDQAPVNLTINSGYRSRLVGRYQLAPTFIFTVSDRDGQLMVKAANQPALEVNPVSSRLWVYREVDAVIEFRLPESGQAKSLSLHQNGLEQVAHRMEDDQETGELPIDEKLRKRLTGRYKLTPNFIFTVRDRDGHLMVGITNQPTQEVYPDSPTRWSYRGIDATLEFKLTGKGRAKSLVLHQNGKEQTAYRIR